MTDVMYGAYDVWRMNRVTSELVAFIRTGERA